MAGKEVSEHLPYQNWRAPACSDCTIEVKNCKGDRKSMTGLFLQYALAAARHCANLRLKAFILPKRTPLMPFRPGQAVPESGAYWVHHYQHRLPQLIHLEQSDV